MNNLTRGFVVVTCLTLSAVNLFSQQTAQRVHYLDFQDGKRNAVIDLRLTPEPDGSGFLEFRMSAHDPEIDPQPGFSGMQGGNAYTAFQLEQLSERPETFFLATFDMNGAFKDGSRDTQATPGMLWGRALRPDGTLDFHRKTPRILHLDAQTGRLEPGYYTAFIWVNAEARFKVSFRLDKEDSRILSTKALSHLPPGVRVVSPAQRFLPMPVTASHAVGTQLPAPQIPLKTDFVAPIEQGTWEPLDVAAKWETYSKSVQADPARISDWVLALKEWKDYAFLETIALYQIDAFQTHHVGSHLKTARAPQWIRVAYWMRNSHRGHMTSSINNLLYDPVTVDEVYSWIEANPEVKEEKAMANLLKFLKKADAKTIPGYVALPPHKAVDLFKGLGQGKALPTVASPRDRAEVQRAIQGLLTSGIRTAPWMDRLFALTRHSDELTRQSAYLAYTHLKPSSIQADAFEKAVKNKKESARIREAALMAFSYGSDARAYTLLTEIAGTANHPAWKASISRLGDLGDAFTLTRFSELELADAEQKAFVERERKRIQERADLFEAKQVAGQAPVWLTRLARAELEGYDWSDDFKAWVFAQIQEHGDLPRIEKKLAAMAETVGKDRAVRRKLRGYIKSLRK